MATALAAERLLRRQKRRIVDHALKVACARLLDSHVPNARRLLARCVITSDDATDDDDDDDEDDDSSVGGGGGGGTRKKKNKPQAGSFYISVESSSGAVLCARLAVKCTTTVGEVKAMVAAQHPDKPVRHQRLFNGRARRSLEWNFRSLRAYRVRMYLHCGRRVACFGLRRSSVSTELLSHCPFNDCHSFFFFFFWSIRFFAQVKANSALCLAIDKRTPKQRVKAAGPPKGQKNIWKVGE